MNIRTIEASTYKGAKVYIRNYKNIFEYLVIYNGELYTTHIVVTKGLIQWLLGKPYTDDQIMATKKMLMNTAQATVDFIEEQNKSKTS